MKITQKNRDMIKKIIGVILALIMSVSGVGFVDFTKEVIADTETITLYFIDNTAEKWVKNDNAVIQLVDNTNGQDYYDMVKVNDTTWSASVPKTAYNITFNRLNQNKSTQWNSWSAGGRDSNNAYYADGAEYGHWSVVESDNENEENYFHAGDIVYLDLTSFTAWENDRALMYINFADATKSQNGGNDINIANANTLIYNPQIVEDELVDYVYSYTITEQDEGKSVLRFWRGNSSTLWNCSVVLEYENYVNGYDCIKVTGWNDTGSIFKSGIITDEDIDSDNDGLPDKYEVSVLETDPMKTDTDDNGISDGEEDFDGDGLTNLQEYLLGTNPFDFDTDGDGFSDNYEELHEMNPLVYDELSVDSSVLAEIYDNTIEDLENLNIDEVYPLEMEFNDEYTQITSISGVFSEVIVSSPIEAVYSIYSIKTLLGIDDSDIELKFNKLNHSISGETYTFQQYYNGIEVYGRTLTVSVDKYGKVTSLQSSFISQSILEKVSLEPQISESKLNNILLNEYEYVEMVSSRLVLYCGKKNLYPQLAYVIQLKNEDINDTVFINAIDGNIIEKFENILYERITGEGQNENKKQVSFPVSKTSFLFYKKYTLEDTSRKIYVYNCNNNDNKYTSKNNTWSDATAISAYTNVITAYDWWKSNFNYVGIDGTGGNVKVYVHDPRYKNNAFYVPNNPSLHFCDTDMADVTKASALDCIGHEYTHAIIDHNTSITNTQYIPGTINEAYADIFGSFINNNTWRIYPRNIADPNEFHNPSVVGGEYYMEDFEEPHGNATIISHAAYLMQQYYNISFEKLHILWYDSMLEGLDDSSDFGTVRNNVIKSARKNGFSYEEISNIRRAFEDVGISGDKGNVKIGIFDGSIPISNATITLIMVILKVKQQTCQGKLYLMI